MLDKNSVSKNRIKSKTLKAAIVLLIGIMLCSCGKSDSKNNSGGNASASSSQATGKEALREKFNSSLGDTAPTWYDSVRNDVTGNWRVLVCYSDRIFTSSLASEYYKAYFSSDQERL